MITKNILDLYRKNEGVVFVCGALHAENLIKKFKENNMDDNVLYYFPHSDKRYDESVDDVKENLSNDTLKNHTFCLRNETDYKSLLAHITKDIKSKQNYYSSEVSGGTASTRRLDRVLHTSWKAFSVLAM